MADFILSARHIQNESLALYKIPHWGYSSRSMPCTNDAGSCEYLDAVYWMHDISMLYTFIMWAVIGGILVIFIALRLLKPRRASVLLINDKESQQPAPQGIIYRTWRSLCVYFQRLLLPEALTSVFGHVTRLQILILAILLAYLLVFSLVGIVYKIWFTPVKGTTLFNTRSGLGGFSDRVGALAYALTPLTVALSTRESILTLLTGISYQHFNFLHRWTGRIIFVQSFLHTLGWTLIEGRLYQPQPTTFTMFIAQPYMIWGCVAMGLITFLYIFSLKRVIAWTGHEFFRKTHYIIAAIYLGACWAHWSRLACWMIASLGIFGIDRGIRLLRTALIHTGHLSSGGLGFKPSQAELSYFDDEQGTVVRIDFDQKHSPWHAGQHFFLCFPDLTIWQSHPFTVASLPSSTSQVQHHTYIVRCLKGETSKLGALAHQISAAKETTPVILTGPYGSPLLRDNHNILLISGGTGVSITLPLALEAASKPSTGLIKFVWIVRQSQNLDWIAEELESLKALARTGSNLDIQIYVTRESGPKSSTIASPVESIKGEMELGVTQISKEVEADSITSSEPQSENNFRVAYLGDHHPNMQEVVDAYMNCAPAASGRVKVVASGMPEMGRDLRTAVAGWNNGSQVWKGGEGEKYDVALHWDNRSG